MSTCMIFISNRIALIEYDRCRFIDQADIQSMCAFISFFTKANRRNLCFFIGEIEEKYLVNLPIISNS